MSRLIMRLATVALAFSLVSTAAEAGGDDHRDHHVGTHQAGYGSDSHPFSLDTHKRATPHCYTADDEIPELPPWPPYCS